MSDTVKTSRRQFDNSVTEHEMTVLQDHGLYRHLRFRRPGTGIYGFDLITWPGHLVITGDLETYHFSRIPDMFEFFNDYGDRSINPHYWGEKLRGEIKYTRYSPEMFTQRVVQDFWERRHERERNTRLWQAIREDVLAHAYDEHEARIAVRDFYFDGGIEPDTFEFYDTWEWDVTDCDWRYLISLHAIVWGIAKYRAAATTSTTTNETSAA